MWRIPLFAVREALRLRTAEAKAGAVLRRALALAGDDNRMREAVLDVYYASAARSVAGISFMPQAIGNRA